MRILSNYKKKKNEEEEVSNEQVENDDIIFVKKILASTSRRITVNKECFYSGEFFNTIKKETYYSETQELFWNIGPNRIQSD